MKKSTIMCTKLGKSLYICSILLVLLLCICSCAQIKYRDAVYTRFGQQELANVYVEADPNGRARLYIGQQKSDFQLGFEFAGMKLKGGAE